MTITPIKTRIFLENENLESFVKNTVPTMQENSILVVTSKIVALYEGRTSDDSSEKNKEQLIHSESDFALKTKHTFLTIKDGQIMASAGIDESNANGKLILLPRNSYTSTKILQKRFKQYYDLEHFGVLITDSRTFPLRAGITGVALGYAGFKGIRDYRKTPDIFGRMMKISRTDVSDSLATAAVLCMGEGAEQQPLAVITDPPVEWINDPVSPTELHIPPEDDLYRPFFEQLSSAK